jgi:hypothetical protein
MGLLSLLFIMFYGKYQWWDGAACSDGHGVAKKRRYRSRPAVTSVFRSVLVRCTEHVKLQR